MTRVLIVDDDPAKLAETELSAIQAGFQATAVTSGETALADLREGAGADVLLLDLAMPDRDGMAVMDALERDALRLPIVVLVDEGREDAAAGALTRGALDYLVKPASPERLCTTVRNALTLWTAGRAIADARHTEKSTPPPETLLTSDPDTERALDRAARAAKNAMPVLIEGETGTGKKLLAETIHAGSDRAGKPFIALDCRGLSSSDITSRLTGAGSGDSGAIAEANGGTLYIEEVGALPEEAQEILLEVLETGEFTPPGARRPVRANPRILTGTSRRLLTLAKAGMIREDLYYRLTVSPVYVPPLRDRSSDIARLAAHFARRLAAEYGRGAPEFSPQALDLLRAHDWPGNADELQRAVAHALALSSAATLEPHDFPQILAQGKGTAELRGAITQNVAPLHPAHIDSPLPELVRTVPAASADRFLDPQGEVTPLADVERELILFAIDRYQGRFAQVARALGIGRSTLYRKLKDYGIGQDARGRAA